MNSKTVQYVAGAAIILLAYVYYKHNKLVTDLKAPANSASLASASADVKKDLGIS